ncbi:MAG: carbonic anhydrase family protein [Saprospiraceae bacterium]
MRTLTKEIQNTISPEMALQLLRNGNLRFINNLKLHRNLLEQVNETSEGQHPFAVVLGCIDSRISAELVFDQGLGDIFSVRVAGNVVNEDVVGSLEFACKVAGAKIVLVLGHTRCGAVKGACDGLELGNLTALLHKIKPAVINTDITAFNPMDEHAFVNAVAEKNVHHVMDEICQASEILNTMVQNGEIGIAGGMYDVETGRVEFFQHIDLPAVTKEGQRIPQETLG